ncbi:unnamed protein product [Mytilus coruscus]|uniref:Retrotransposon gag domain-containing protein n=1 Tax=Mytilus coruscus TaxID=42192 RepID=A0A6J8CNN4_MYTCO|nr:unnamed protein product [Mytilus coruscus]
METPRKTIRTSTQAPMLSQVRQNCFRNQLFFAGDSVLGSSPATGTLHDVRIETMPDIRYRQRIGHCSPRNNQDRAVQEMSKCRDNKCTDINGTTTEYPNTSCIRGRNFPPSNEYLIRRTFFGARDNVWNEFIQYFENISELNVCNNEKSRRVLLSARRGQAETYAYGMPVIIQGDYNRLKRKMEERFGRTAIKEKYVTEAKLRKRQLEESLRDFGQAIEPRAYPGILRL